MEGVTHDEHGEDGKFTATYDPDEFVAAVDALELPTTADVADRVDCPHRTALHHLNKHEDEGRLSSRTVGPAKVWCVADDRDATSAREGGVTPSDESTTQPSQTAATAQAGDTSAEAAGLDTVEFPEGREHGACVAAVQAARDHLRDHGPATMRELVAAVMPDHPLGYDVDDALEKIEAGDRFRGAWWRRVVKPGLEARDDVEKPPRGGSDWTYTGDQDTDTDPLDTPGPYDPTDE